MQTLLALAIILAIQSGAADLLQAPLVVQNLSDLPSLPLLSNGPVPMPKIPAVGSSTQKSSSPRKHPARTTKNSCAPSAKYSLSSRILNDYLMATLPLQIEQLVKCEEVNLGGVLGQVLATVGNSGLLSLLNISSILDMGGGLGLGSILGKGGDGESPKRPLVSKITGAVGDLPALGQKSLGGLLPPVLKDDKNAVKGLLNGTRLSNLQQPLNEAVETVDNLKESAQDVVNSVLPPGINDALSGLLDINIEGLLLKVKVQEVTVENVESTMTDNEINARATATATIDGEGLLGPVISLLGFQADLDVTLKIVICSNNTQCVNLEVLETKIKVNQVTLETLTLVTEILPLPVPLPLNSIVSTVVTVEINSNMEKAESCGIVLSDFNNCKNSTGLLKYQVKSARISQNGLSILYCAKALLGKNEFSVPGGLLPPDPKNANISISISSVILKKIFTQAAIQSFAKVNNQDANIIKVTYVFQPENTIRGTYQVNINKDGKSFANGETTFTISHTFKISNTKVTADFKLTRLEHKVNPPEAEEEVEDVMSELSKMFWTNLVEMIDQLNVPSGVSSSPINNADITVLKSNALQAAN